MNLHDVSQDSQTAADEFELIERGYEPLSMGVDQRLGFLPWEFIAFSLPYQRQASDKWVRTNGNYRLTIRAGEVVMPDGSTVELLPYGKYARAALLWMCTQARITGSRTLELGTSYNAFLAQLGIGGRPEGVARGGQSKRNVEACLMQLRALFASTVSVSIIDNERAGVTGVHEMGYRLSHKSALWFDPRQPSGVDSLLPSTVTLSEGLMESIERARVVDLRGWKNIQAASKSPLALDVYVWLCARLWNLSRPSYVTWEQLHAQFGSNDSLGSFRQSFRKALAVAQAEYPAARIKEMGRENRSGFRGFLLKRSEPAIAPRSTDEGSSGE